MMEWHDTNSLETKLLQVPHSLSRWDVYHAPGAGRGVVRVLAGPLPNPPPLIASMLQVHSVVRVVSDVLKDQGYFLIMVSEPKFWDQVKADIQGIIVRDQQKEK